MAENKDEPCRLLSAGREDGTVVAHVLWRSRRAFRCRGGAILVGLVAGVAVSVTCLNVLRLSPTLVEQITDYSFLLTVIVINNVETMRPAISVNRR
ncbi:MAG: hypothetical protein H7308_06830 [Chthonomonadaceae bacterium]|nr:hypothetical protein [Chthonomonadaceae bacterium]